MKKREYKKILNLLSIGYLVFSFCSPFKNQNDLDHCCLEENHEVFKIGNKLFFNGDNSNYGEIIVEANYLPVGSITDTVWTTSNDSKVTVNPIGSEYSNICKLIAVNRFNDEVLITAQSKIYSDIKYESKVSWRSNLIITPLTSSLTLSATKTYNCPASYSTNYMSKALSQLFTIDGSDEGMTYSLSNSNVIISGSDVKANSCSNCTSILTATSIEDSSVSASIPITVSYSTNGNSTTHSYKYSTCTTRYETSTSYGSWVTDSAATCTTSGSKHRSKTVTKLRYDNDKFVCSFCGDYYWSGEYHLSYGDTSTTTTETSTIAALGHNYVTQTGKAATCTEAGYSSYSKCSRCGAETGKSTISALGHKYDVYGCYYCARCDNYCPYDTCDECGKTDETTYGMFKHVCQRCGYVYYY